ncbi:asparagine synthetase B family protein (plasmid) [Neorhizobium sp. DAR64861/K0K2]|uniref:asparagine synthetase B family protein n=1 Tax=Neorhizobium sp. DAR64861/K0K2 TaxID=3421956 RepID=UPI003D2774B3
MCGISAITLADGLPQEVKAKLELMNAAQFARGPDGAGVAISGSAGVGMVRLRVRADEREPEPIPLNDRQSVAYNGEVYWSGDGAPAGGEGEVRAIYNSGPHPPDGMYAMASLDHVSQTVEVCRDAFGIKPIWLRKLPNGLAVGSTVKSLLSGFGSDSPRIEGIHQFLAFGRPIDGGSCLTSIAAIPPGTTLNLKSGLCINESRMSLVNPSSSQRLNDPHVLGKAIRDSVQRVLPSNRAMGLAVSGGLDSTILAHEMAQLGVETLHTVSVLVEGTEDGISDLSQLKLPDRATRSWSHTTVTVTSEQFASRFEGAVRTLGEPTRLSSVPLYEALADGAQAAGIVVLQLGEGADELFMGYSSYRAFNPDTPDSLFQFILPESRHPYLEALCGAGIIQECRNIFEAKYPPPVSGSRFEHLRRMELDHSLEPLLRRADQILMTRSIEGRTPFLHGGVPEFALSIDASHHLSSSRTKPMLRDAFPYLDLLEGPWRNKTPFRAPISKWLQTSLRPWMLRVLDEGMPVLRNLGLLEEGITLVREDACLGKVHALEMALSLMSLVFWADWLANERPSNGNRYSSGSLQR